MLVISGNKYVLLSSREEKGRHLSHERFISFFQGEDGQSFLLVTAASQATSTQNNTIVIF